MPSKYLKVEDEKSLVRDTTNQAILNTDISAVNKHELRMKQINKEQCRDKEINSLKQDIAEIRDLLLQFMKQK